MMRAAGGGVRQLDDGSRVPICVLPASPSVAITVRRSWKRSFSAAQLVEQGALPANVLLTRRRSDGMVLCVPGSLIRRVERRDLPALETPDGPANISVEQVERPKFPIVGHGHGLDT